MLSKDKKINTQLFKEVLNKGKTHHFTYFSVKTLKSPVNENKSKFTIVVSKKIVKKAISRNLIRRRFFNIIKDIYKDFPTPYAFIFFLKKEGKELNYKDLKKEIEIILKYEF